MYFNKFITSDGREILDLSRSEVTSETLAKGATALDKTGKFIRGIMANDVIGGLKDVVELPEADIDLESIYRITEEKNIVGKYYICLGDNPEIESIFGAKYFTIGEFYKKLFELEAGVQATVTECFYEVTELPNDPEPMIMDQATLTVHLPQYILADSGKGFVFQEGSWVSLAAFMGGDPMPEYGFINSTEEITEAGGYATRGEGYNIYHYWKYADGYWNKVTPIFDVAELPTSKIAIGACYRLNSLDLCLYVYDGEQLLNYNQTFEQQGIVPDYRLFDTLPEGGAADGGQFTIYITKSDGVAYAYNNGVYISCGQAMGINDGGWIDSTAEITEPGVYILGEASETKYYTYKNSWVQFTETSAQGGFGDFLQNFEAESLTLPKGIKELAPYLCYNRGYKEITIPSGVQSIGEYCFAGCNNLTTIYYEGSYRSFTNIIIDKEAIPESVIIKCSDNTIIKNRIGYQLTADGQGYSVAGALPGHPRIMTFEQTIEDIPVVAISEEAFQNNTGIDIINLHEGITTIGRRAFYSASSLLKINLPASLISIGKNAFQQISLLEVENNSTFVISAESTDQNSIDLARAKNIYSSTEGQSKITFENDFIFFEQEAGLQLARYSGASKFLEMPYFEDRPYSVANNAFSYANIIKLVIPEGVTSLQGLGITQMKNLVSLTLPSTLVEPITSSFYDLTRLFEIYNLSSLKIDKDSSNSNNLGYYAKDIHTSYDVESKVNEYGDYVFYADEKLPLLVGYPVNDTSLKLPKDFNGQVYGLADGIFSNITARSVILSDNIVHMGRQPFGSLEGSIFRNVLSEGGVYYLPSYNSQYFMIVGCTSVGPSGGSFTTNLETRFIGYKGLYDCYCDELILSDGLIGIDEYAFQSANFETILFPTTLKYINQYAFRYMYSLKTIKVPNISAWAQIDFASYANPLDRSATSANNTAVFLVNEQQVAGTDITITGIERIGARCFSGIISFGNVIIENGIKEIGEYAFQLTKMTSITLPASLTRVENGGLNANVGVVNIPNFASYCNIEFEGEETAPTARGGKLYSNGELVDITSFPEGITKLPPSLFQNNQEIKTITIPNTVTKIPPYFAYQSSLEEVHFPDGLLEIGTYAFYDTNLAQISLPETLKEIRSYAFDSNPFTEVILPQSLEAIYTRAFSRTGLREINIPKNVKKLDNYVFQNCYNLTKVTFESVPNEIGTYLFSGCRRLNNLSEDVVRMLIRKTGSFSGCSKLTSISIPEDLESIGSSAFQNCTRLFDIINLSDLELEIGATSHGYVAQYAKSIVSSVEDSRSFSVGDYHFYRDENATYLLSYTGQEEDLVLPALSDETYEIYEETFIDHTFIKTVTIPEGVTAIGVNAFKGCTSLTSVALPDSIQSLDGTAFDGCTALAFEEYENCRYLGNDENKYNTLFSVIDKTATTITIHDATKIILPSACSDCTAVTTLTLPSALVTVGGNAFTNCTALTQVNIDNFDHWREIDFANVGANPCSNSTAKLFVNNEALSLGEYVLPNTTRIKPLTFYNQTSLITLTLPSTLETIGENAFTGCSSLNGVYIDSLSHWCSIEFEGLSTVSSPSGSNPISSTTGAITLYVNNVPVVDAQIFDEAITRISNNAFAFYSKIASLILQAEGVEIGEGAFRGNALVELVLPKNAKIEKYAFAYGTKVLATISLTEGNIIGNGAFYQAKLPLNLSLPEGISEIGEIAFGNTNLQTISFPESLQTIPDYLCRDCTSLTAIDNWGGVKTIGKEAFYDAKISNLVLKEGIEEIGEKAFVTDYSLKNITIPSTLKKLGKRAFYSGNYKSSVVNRIITINDLPKWCNAELEDYTASPFYVYYSNSGSKPIHKVIINGTEVTNITIPTGINKIGANVFYMANALEQVVIPEGVQEIGECAFGEIALNKIFIPTTLKKVGNLALYAPKEIYITDADAWLACDFERKGSYASVINSDTKIFLNNELLTEITLKSTSRLGKYAFNGYKYLFRATIESWPGGGYYVTETFDCDCLREVLNLTDNYLYPGSSILNGLANNAWWIYKKPEDRRVFIDNDFAVYLDSTGDQSCIIKYLGDATEVILPDTLEGKPYGFDKWSFYNKSNITKMTLPATTTFINGNAFNGCVNWEGAVNIDASDGIYSYAFKNCGKLTEIRFNKDAKSFASNVYEGCTGAKYLTFGNALNTSYFDKSSIPYTSHDRYYTFYNSVLEGFYLSHNITGKGWSYWDGCSALKRIDVDQIGFLCSMTNRENNVKASIFYKRPDLYLNGELVETLVVPDGVEKIESYTFCNATFKKVILPSSVKQIGDYAFYGCANLQEVVLPEGLTTIGASAFDSCPLARIVLPSTLTSIGGSAFYGCSKLFEVQNLSALTITKGGTDNGYVGYYAKHIYGTEGTSIYAEQGDFLFLAAEGETPRLMAYKGEETEVTLPESYNGQNYELFEGAFKNNSRITKVSFSMATTSTGYNTFQGCTNLTEVVLSESVKTIDSYSFDGCSALKKVTMPAVEAIISYAFQNCKNLMHITIPATVTTIGNNAFYQCLELYEVENLSSLTITKGSSGYGYVGYYALRIYSSGESGLLNQGDYVFLTTEEQDYLVRYTGQDRAIALPERDKGYIVYKYVFQNTSVEEVVMPDGILSCASGCFQNAKKLKKAILPSNWTTLNASFSETDIEEVVLPASLTTIPGQSFYICKKLKAISIPEGVTSIGTQAFAWCEGLTSIEFPESLTNIGAYAFRDCTSIQAFTFPQNVTSIGDYAFVECDSLTKIKFMGNPTISSTAFSYNTLLTEIEIPANFSYSLSNSFDKIVYNGSLKEWCDNAVNASGSLFSQSGESILYINGDEELGGEVNFGEDITTISPNSFRNYQRISSAIFEGLVTIGATAFYKAGLSSLTIDKNESSIGSYAFAQCNITQISLPGRLSYIGDDAFEYNLEVESFVMPHIIKIDNHPFGYARIKSVIFEEGITDIPDYLCKNMPILQRVEIPEGVISIGKASFALCQELAQIKLPDSLVEIKDSAFASCNQLHNITFPNTLTTIGDYAFQNIDLTEIIIPSNVTNIGKQAFANTASNRPEVALTAPLTATYGYKAFGCNLVSVQFTGEGTKLPDNFFSGAAINTLSAIEWPETITEFGVSAFEGSSLVQANVPAQITALGAKVFYGCNYLEEIQLSDKITTNPSYFFSLSKIDVYKIPSHITTLADNAFAETTVSTLIVPESVTTIGVSALYAKDHVLCSASEAQAGWAEGFLKAGPEIIYGSSGEEVTYTFITGCDPEAPSVVSSIPVKLDYSLSPEGYYLEGWYETEDYSSEKLKANYYSNTDITLYAKQIPLTEIDARSGLTETEPNRIGLDLTSISYDGNTQYKKRYTEFTAPFNGTFNFAGNNRYIRLWAYDANGKQIGSTSNNYGNWSVSLKKGERITLQYDTSYTISVGWYLGLQSYSIN